MRSMSERRVPHIVAGWVALVFVICLAVGQAKAENVTLDHNGLSLNGNVTLAEGKTLSDGVILITHGTLAHNRMEVIAAMQTALAERGLNTLAITLSLGLSGRTGMYDCNTPHKHRHTDALDEIGAWLNWLKSKDANQVVLMGHSRGGNQTAWFAAERLEPTISRVVLLAPATWNKEKSRANYKKQYGASVEPLLAKAEKMVGENKGDQLLKKIGFLYCKDASASAQAVISYYTPNQKRHTPDLLKSIQVPVLVIAGSEDKVVEGLIEATKPLADGEKIQLKVIEDADHFFRDFHAEDAADAIEEFLNQ